MLRVWVYLGFRAFRGIAGVGDKVSGVRGYSGQP